MIVHSQPADMFEVKPYLIVKLAVPVGKILGESCILIDYPSKQEGIVSFDPMQIKHLG